LKHSILLACVAIAAAAICGCSAQQAYNSAQGYERNQCERIPDQGARERCLANASATYDAYKRQSGDLEKK
jgi:hypothetical protein